MKKKMLLIMMCLLVSLPCAYAFAAERADNPTIVLQIDHPLMTINGVDTEIDQGRGTTPTIVEGRTLLPLRAVVEGMGGTVVWDERTQTATLMHEDDEIRLTIGEQEAYLNGEAHMLDVAPVSINDRTMLPIRFVAEGFGYLVGWNAATQAVTLTKNTAIAAEVTVVSADMALIEGGTFTMGSPANEAERSSDERQRQVTVDSFYMAKTELTQAAYEAIMGSNPSENRGDDLPIENMTWYDAIAYCNKRSEAEGLTPCYTIDHDTVTWDRSANGYRLPTEAEWEYACRAQTETPFNFGVYVEDSDANCYNAYGYNNDATGRWVNDYLGHTVAANSYPANGNGLYHMHGNVAEWVWDWYGPYQTDNVINPTGPQAGNYKIARGGGWNDMPKHIRSAYRSAFPADVPLYSIGMRLVRSAQPMAEIVTSIDQANAKTGKVLIAYFSQTGNTEGLAQIIADETGADIFRIERATPYSSTGNSQGLYGEALTEYRENAVPDLKMYLEDAGLDINDYDTILLGYSNWWASIPAPVRSFLMRYDFSDKTIIPFCTMGGGRFGQTISAVAKLAPDSTIKQGLDITYSSYQMDRIAAWLAANQISMKE